MYQICILLIPVTCKTKNEQTDTWSSWLGIRSANPQSEIWGLRSSSNSMLDDLKFLWMIGGEQVSCRYLKTTHIQFKTTHPHHQKTHDESA